jgi:hypothetical protein
MSDFGTFNVCRGLFKHPVFPNEPFTHREAWMWMIGAAARTPGARRIGNHAVVELARGQLAFSHRFLAERFQWSVARVQRFLARLVTESMIESVTESGVTRVTICNYAKYQPVPEYFESPTDTPPSQREDKLLLSTQIDIDGVDARARESCAISKEAFDLADEIMLLLGIDLKFVPPGWCGAALWFHTGLTAGWRPELVRIAAAKIRARKRYEIPFSFRYLAKPIQREHEFAAEPHLPMPPVVVSKGQETAHAAKTTEHPAHGWQQSRDRFRNAVAKLGDALDQHDAGSAAVGGNGAQVVPITAAAGRGRS